MLYCRQLHHYSLWIESIMLEHVDRVGERANSSGAGGGEKSPSRAWEEAGTASKENWELEFYGIVLKQGWNSRSS